MPCILNIHTPSHSYALPYREGEDASALISRITKKSGLEEKEVEAITQGKDGAGIKYEFEGGRWSLQDDDDLEILLSRLPPSSTDSITLHLTPTPQTHLPSSTSSNTLYKSDSPNEAKVPRASKSVKSMKSIKPSVHNGHQPTINGITGAVQLNVLEPAEQESLGDRHKRQWKAFHEGRGVRTVQGKLGKVEGVRMLLKSGYRHVYVSRAFAVKNGLIPKESAMGTYGYAGLVNLGKMPITVGHKTESHTVMLSEETNFDVVLGRSWMEKMGIKTDPIDQTSLVYMDSGEQIHCDIVVLKDAKGSKVTIT